MANTIHMTIVTPAERAFEGDAVSIVVPAFDGEMGVMANHAAIISLLGHGELRHTDAGGVTRKIALRGGFVQVRDNRLNVLTEAAVPAENLATDKLEAERQALEAESVPDNPEAQAIHREKLQWVDARLKIARTTGS